MIFLDIGLLQLYTRHTMTTIQMTTIQQLEDRVSNYIHKEDDESKTALVAFVNGAAEIDEGWGKDTWFEYTDDELMTLAGDFLEEDNQQTKTDLIQFIIRYVMQ